MVSRAKETLNLIFLCGRNAALVHELKSVRGDPCACACVGPEPLPAREPVRQVASVSWCVLSSRPKTHMQAAPRKLPLLPSF